MGYQWFPIPWIDGSSEEASREGMERAVADLDAWLDATLAEAGVAASDAVLLGFSQGAMMALHVAPRRAEAVGGVIAIAGRLLDPEVLGDAAVSRPPVLLVHGDADEVVPVRALPQAAEALEAAGFERVYAHVMEGTGHGIAPDGLQVSLAFLRDVLRID